MKSDGDLRHLSVVSGEHVRGRYAQLVAKLRAAGYLEPQEEVGTDFKVLCPIHESSGRHAPSLHVTRTDDGDVRVWCAGSCSNSEVYSQIMADDAVLDRCRAERVAGSGEGGNRVSSLEVVSEQMYATWCAQEAQDRVYELGIYTYRSRDGHEVVAKVKWSNKDFSWLRKDADGWRRGLKGKAVPLYRLDEVLARLEDDPSTTLWVVEGEKDADRLWEDGLAATCSNIVWTGKEGAGHPVEALSAHVGTKLVVIPDNDDKGLATARRFARAAKTTQDITVMRPLGDAPGYDVSDFLDGGGSISELLWRAAQTADDRGAGSGDGDGEDDGGVADDVDGAIDEIEVAGGAAAVDGDDDVDDERERRVRRQLQDLEVRAEARRRLEAGAWTAPPLGLTYTLAEARGQVREVRKFYIESVFVERHTVTLAGKAKAGKTTMTGNVIRSLVDRVPLLGSLESEGMLAGGRVGAWNCEMDSQDYDEYLLAMGITARGMESVAMAHLQGYSINLLSDTGAEWTVEWLRRAEVEVWIPDPWSKICSWSGVSENDNTDTKRLQTRIDEIKREAGVKSMFIATHPPRAADGSDGTFARTRGAAANDEWPDALWSYSRDGDQRYLMVEGRNRVGLSEVALEFDPRTNLLSGKVGTRREVRRDEKSGEVLAIITEAGLDGVKAGVIYEAVGGNRNDVKAALNQLERLGQAHCEQQGTSKLWRAGPGHSGWDAAGIA